MEPDQAQEISDRDQLWASLRNLRAEIALLADGDRDGSPRQEQVILLLARIVLAEIDFRAKHHEPE